MATRRTPLDHTLGRLVPNIQVAKTVAKVGDSEQAQNLIAVHMDALINAVRVPQQAPYSAGDDLALSTWEGWFRADLTPGVQSPVGASCQENGVLFTGRSYINEQLSGYAVCGVAAVGDRVGVLHASRDHEWFTLLLRMTEQEFQQVVSEHGFANADLQRERLAWYIELKEEAAHVLLDSLALVPKKANQAHHPEALSVLCHAAHNDWLSNGSGGDSTDLTGLVTDEQPPRLRASTSRLRLVVFAPYPEELEACFDAMGRPETFDARNDESGDDSDGELRPRSAVTLAQRVIEKDVWGPTHGTTLTYEGIQIFQTGRSRAATYGVDDALVKDMPRFNELMHSSKRGRLLRFTRPNGQTCAYPQPLVKRASMSAPNGAAAASTKPKPKTTTTAKPKPKTTAATAKPKAASGKAGAPKPVKAGATKPAKAGKATKADAKGATKTITKTPKAKAAPKPKPAASVAEDDTEDTVAAAAAPAEIAEEEAPASEKDPAPSVSAIEPSDVDEEDSDSETNRAAKARAKAAAAKAAARSAAAKKAAATKAAKRVAAGGGEGKAPEKKKKEGKAGGGARARKRQKTSSDSDDGGTGDDSDDYMEPETDESEEASASGSEFDCESGDDDDDDDDDESESGGDKPPRRPPVPADAPVPIELVPAPAVPAAPTAPTAPAVEVSHLQAMTKPVCERLARRIVERSRPWGSSASTTTTTTTTTAEEAWWDRLEGNHARLRDATTPTDVLTAALSLLDAALEKEEAMSNDATLPLSASQVGDVRAMMQKARDLGKETLPNLEQAIQINESLVRSNAQMRAHLSTMLESSMAAMETIQPAVRALQAASAAPVGAPVEQPRAED